MMRVALMRVALVVALVVAEMLAWAVPAAAQTVAPPAVQAIDIEERLGAPVSLDVQFHDEHGRALTLRDAFGRDGKPVILILAYYRCPMLCELVQRGAAAAMAQIEYDLAKDYRVVTVSFDPNDTELTAQRTKSMLLKQVEQPSWDDKWPFLLGSAEDVAHLADQLGFRYAYDPATDQFAHASVVFVLTGDGRISRYLYGVDFRAKDVELALVEAGQGKVGSVVDRIILSCYQYDPATRRYGPYIQGFIRIGAVVIFIVFGTLMAIMFARDRRRQREGTT